MKKTILAIFLTLIFLIPTAIIVAENPVLQKALVNTLKCTGCGDCTKVCPTKAITLVNQKAVVDTDKCINCLICVKTCNYTAISGSRELK